MKMTRLLQAAGVLAVAIALQPHVAMARSTAASTGNANAGGSNACFNSAFGWVQNICASAQNWEVPAVVDVPGLYTVTINVSTSMTCGAFSSTQAGAFFSGPANTFGTGNRVFANINVPAAGTLNGFCSVPTNGRVHSMNW